MGIEPSPDGVREAAGASGGQGSEIFCNGELVESEAKYETRVTDSHLGHRNKKLGLISSFLFCLFPTCRTCGNFIPPLLYLLISKYFL